MTPQFMRLLASHLLARCGLVEDRQLETLLMAVALAPVDGHSCLYSDEPTLVKTMARWMVADGAGGDPVFSLADLTASLSPESLQRARQYSLLTTAEEHSTGAVAPLILAGTAATERLYLRRYYLAELQLAQDLQRRTRVLPTPPDEALFLRLFSGDSDQAQAVRGILHHGCSLLSGGPGTGKTTTVGRLLALLLSAETNPERCAIRLLAPTGKAQARLAESLWRQLQPGADGGGLESLGSVLAVRYEPILRALLRAAESSSTIHRALQSSTDVMRGFRYGADHQLPEADIVIIDESSMISLELMGHLLAAIPEAARIVFVGDADQLPAVGVGSLFGDLCAADTARLPVFRLHHSHRQSPTVAAALRRIMSGALPESVGSKELVEGYVELKMIASRQELDEQIDAWIATHNDGYSRLLHSTDPDDMQVALRRQQILSPVNSGSAGTGELNRRVCLQMGIRETEIFTRRGLPIMVRTNDNRRRIYNGDTGFTDGSGAVFLLIDGSWQIVALDSLPRYELCFASTVHKSQGSEYSHVLLVMPLTGNPQFTRELIYTAATRAKVTDSGGGITIISNKEVLSSAVAEQVSRASGIALLLDPDYLPPNSLGSSDIKN